MGRKIAMSYLVLCGLVALGQITSLFVRWHMAGGNLLLTMDTTLWSSKMGGGGLAFLCHTLLSGWTQCQELSKGMWLQDIQSQTCAKAVVMLSSGPCEAYKAAYIIGMISVFAFVLNWLLMASSGAILWQYLSGKHKAEYRNWSFYLLCAGWFLVLVALLLWSFVALPALDQLGSLVNWGHNPAGASYGYFWMWFSFVFETIAGALHWWMPLNDELTEEDRLEQKMEQERQQYGAAAQAQYQGYGPGYPAYGAGYGAGYGASPGAPPYPVSTMAGYPGAPPQWGQQPPGPAFGGQM